MAKKLLIIDDYAMFRQAMRVALSQVDGYEIRWSAESAEQALELLEDIEPDAILMDISLPGMSGVECTRRIRERGDIPIIALSMHDQGPHRREILAAGAQVYVLKATPLDELVAVLDDLLGDGVGPDGS